MIDSSAASGTFEFISFCGFWFTCIVKSRVVTLELYRTWHHSQLGEVICHDMMWFRVNVLCLGLRPWRRILGRGSWLWCFKMAMHLIYDIEDVTFSPRGYFCFGRTEMAKNPTSLQYALKREEAWRFVREMGTSTMYCDFCNPAEENEFKEVLIALSILM